MLSRRRSGLARWCLTAVALLAAPVSLAQVTGEVLVGRVDSTPSPTPPAGEAPALPGELAEPRPVVLPQPVYPRAARAARQEGRVMVCFTLDERGRVQAPAVRSSTDDVFNQPVLDAISAARFTPARAGPDPVRSTACRTFRFVLR